MKTCYVVVEELLSNIYKLSAETAEEAEESWFDGDIVSAKTLQEDVIEVSEDWIW